jgi:hypothetical protein
MRLIIIVALLLTASFVSAQTEYKNPVDGKTYKADWKTYQPEGGVKAQDGRVVNTGVRLLSTQDEYEKNTSAEEIAKLVRRMQEVLAEKASEYPESGEMLVQIELSNTSNPKFKMSHKGSLKQEYLQIVYETLSKIQFKTKISTVSLQVSFLVKGS